MVRCRALCGSLVPPKRRPLLAARAGCNDQCPSGQNLLLSLVELNGASVQHLKLEARTDGAKGRGLYAVEDIRPGELLLDVPWEEVFTEDGDGDGLWGAEMGIKLAKLSKQESKSEVCSAWLESLPRDPMFPPLAFSSEQLSLISDGTTRTEALNIRASMKNAFEELSSECGISWEEFDHAVSVLHGRCFALDDIHVTVPGIDLANHSFDPSARVNIAHNPDFSQGLSALEEICDPPVHNKAPVSIIQLIANDFGIKSGEEVTISYGPWPNDVLFLLFGFVMPENPNDVAVLFADELDLLDFFEELLVKEAGRLPECFPEVRQMTEAWCLEQGIDFGRMVASYQGIDGRIEAIVKAVHTHSKQLLAPHEQAVHVIQPGILVHWRCDRLLRAFKNGAPVEQHLSLIQDVNDVKATLLESIANSLATQSKR